MEVVKSVKGKTIGRISVLHTIATMDVAETWNTNNEEVDFGCVRASCSRYGSITGKRFTVNSPIEAEGAITVTRTL